MIKQGFINNDSILEKKFKILRTSIILGNLSNKESALLEYENTAKEIDRIRKSVYEEILASKDYTTSTLEEEKERLLDLISFIENRVKERNEFIDDYIKVTNKFLSDIDEVEKEKDIPTYKNRLDNITKYLNNKKEIEEIVDILDKLRKELEEKYENKANNEIINNKLEDELIDEFNKIISSDEYYRNLNYIDISTELDKLNIVSKEKLEVMNTFISSYEALKDAGISGADREEYLSYVKDSKLDYYQELDKIHILNIYKLILDKIVEYDKLLIKRDSINTILEKRENDRLELDIRDYDKLINFINLFKEQYSIIKSQKYNIENIEGLLLDISKKEERLNYLEEDNKRDGIKELLEEFLIENKKIEKIELPEEKKIYENVISKNKELEKKPDNLVVRIEEPIKMNIKNSSDMAKLVMKKVVLVLEPKKYENKKDKIKEAELELLERRRKERLEREERLLKESISNKEDSDIDNELNHTLEDLSLLEIPPLEDFDDNSSDKKDINIDDELNHTLEDLSLLEIPPLEDFDDHSRENGMLKLADKDIFTDDDPGEPNYNLGNMEDYLNSLIKEEEMKKNMPMEVILDNQPSKLDIFTETDPFLDDNEFEINKNILNENSSNIPLIKNIGSVKPNTLLDKVENVSNNNDNIVLPTLGLSKKVEESVPIVSENYIN